MLAIIAAALVMAVALLFGRRQLGWNGVRGTAEDNAILPRLPAAQTQLSESKIAFTDFAGAEACEPCHAEQYEVWKKSTHGNAGGEPGQAKVIAKFNGVPLHFKDAVVVPTRNHNGEYVFIIKPNGQPEQEIKVAAIIGGGHMIGGGTQSFFAKYPDGTLKFLPFDFIRAENTWFVQLRARNDWAPVRRDISLDDLANWPPHRILGAEPQHSNCQNCHGSQILVQYDMPARRFITRYQTLRINCESCHGPGRRHIELMQSENAAQLADIGMAPLSTLSKEQSLEVCFQCHATKDAMQSGYLPGKSFAEHYAVKFPILGSAPYLPDGRVRHFAYQENHLYSACYLEGSMTCVDCHDPHSQNYRDVFGNALPGRFDNAQCTGCHASKVKNAEAHAHHRAGPPGNSCVACHMPYLQHQLLGTRLKFARSDHSIPIPRPAFDAQLGIENACSKCHRERPVEELQAQVERWYGELKPHHVQVANFMAAQSVSDFKTAAALLLNASPSHPMAQVAGLSQFMKDYLRQDMEGLDAEALVRLKLLAESSDLEVRALALTALHAGAGNDRNVRAFLIEKLQTAGASENALRRRWAIAMDYLGVMAGERGDFNQAIAAHQKALEIIPEDYATLMNLGIAYQSKGEVKQAISTLQRALVFAPEQAAIYFQLAQAYLAAQQFSAARASLQEGLRYDPDNESAKDLLRQLQSP
ncbi:ammonia-forming cytochrome c nitrite reductase subunit c552 [candidate division KSB1 bacterium]|nr:ammonia-forming cytochrome c nitrite reductase subunit c552 [candidate division KSB1 bacterium]